MPITPFHFGPGLLFKAALGTHFSFSAFVATNVLIDVESAVNMARGAWPVHTRLHTLPGSLVVAMAVIVLGRPLLSALHRAWNRHAGPTWQVTPSIPVVATVVGALAGAVSHVALDGIMHSDARPLAPWVGDNPLYAWIGMGLLHQACLACGVVGLALLLSFRWRAGRPAD